MTKAHPWTVMTSGFDLSIKVHIQTKYMMKRYWTLFFVQVINDLLLYPDYETLRKVMVNGKNFMPYNKEGYFRLLAQ